MTDILSRPNGWPWVQRSVLSATVDEERRPANSWLNLDLGTYEVSDSDSDYAHSEGSGSTETSDKSDRDISDSELADIGADAAVRWPSWRTLSQEKIEEREDLRSSLAAELGYTTNAISLMLNLPYVDSHANRDDETSIVGGARFADYTLEEDLKEGRRPSPYRHLDNCPDLDPWVMPLVLPGRDGWIIMLDTRLGVVRAYGMDCPPPEDTVEWRRHGEVAGDEWDRMIWTEYRRAPLVPVAQYFPEIIDAYRSLARLPLIEAHLRDPMHKRVYSSYYPGWIVTQERELLDGLLGLYRECGWPDEWRRAEFVTKWAAKRKEIDDRAREEMQNALP
ncbi:hypothetical protein B0H17DRAFT_1063515 [Mycena rosella]|uniref:Uncharacterized protein n=1 Tax=Mycena rosella TaxID=1033263 RepID=A0AAD7DHA3_MYCRO|nr:hypothetical protein B0H17DRAFT_1063515 [Mycena rosella]